MLKFCNMDYLLSLADLISDNWTKALFICLLAFFSLGIFINRKLRLSVFAWIELVFILLASVFLMFSGIFPKTNVNYAVLFSHKNLRIVKIVMLACILLLCTVILLPELYLKSVKCRKPKDCWTGLKDIKLSLLSGWQQKKYVRQIAFVLIQMGAIKRAESYLALLGDGFKNSDFDYLIQEELAYLQGDMKKIIEISELAAASIKPYRTPALYKYLFLHNLAVAYTQSRDYINADKYYDLAYPFIKSRKIKNWQTIVLFYKNYLVNTLCMDSNHQKVLNLLSDFKKRMNRRNIEHWMQYYDLHLDVLQHTHADVASVDKNIEESLLKLNELKIPEPESFIYSVHVARIVTSYHANPEHCIAMLKGKSKYLSELEFVEKYYIVKDLEYLFRELRGPIIDEVYDLKLAVSNYFSNEAEREILTYLKKLQPEDVWEQISFYKELGNLKRTEHNSKSFEEVRKYLKSAAKLCRANRLDLTAATIELDIADEAIAPYNISEDGLSLYTEDVVQIVKQQSEFARNLSYSPMEAELDFRIAYYALVIHDYDTVLEFYNHFKKTNVPEEKFASWCRRYISIERYVCHILKVIKGIEDVSHSKEMITFDEDVQEFFENYKKSDGYFLSLLLGSFSGKSLFPVKCCTYCLKGNEFKHWWFVNPDWGLEIDFLYDAFKQDEYNNHAFFTMDRHPLEAKLSNTMKIAERSKTELLLVDGNAVQQELAVFIGKLFDIIKTKF